MHTDAQIRMGCSAARGHRARLCLSTTVLHSKSRLHWMGCLLFACVCWGAACKGFSETPPGTNSLPGAELFAEGMVCHLDLEITPRALEKLANEAREFVRAKVREGNALYQEVGVHLKGSVGSFRPVDDKPGFTLDFANFRDGQRFHGLRRIHLNNSVEDPSYCNELLGGELFRAAGIPSPRVTRATVTLNGRKLGLYVLKEGFTEDFLSCYFKAIGGNLFEPEEGHDVNEHLKRVSVRAPTSDRGLLKALAQAALEADLTHRWKQLGSVLEMNRFIRFMALEVILCHRDGYCLARNNFRVYQNIDTGKMVFLPQGMDQLFGIPELPWMPHMAGLVARATLETTEGKQRYAEASKNLFQTLFRLDELTNRLHDIVAPLHAAVSESEFERIQNAAADLNHRIVERHRYLETQIREPFIQMLEFKSGFASLGNWTKADEPSSVRMETAPDPEGIVCVKISTHDEASASWHTKALLPPGRYRFEGRARVSDVKPLPFGTHQGAGLRIGGQQRQVAGLTGTIPWQQVSTQFEIESRPQETEFICELRAAFGTAWFDAGSLRVVQEP